MFFEVARLIIENGLEHHTSEEILEAARRILEEYDFLKEEYEHSEWLRKRYESRLLETDNSQDL